jgi:hypothetical protein
MDRYFMWMGATPCRAFHGARNRKIPPPTNAFMYPLSAFLLRPLPEPGKIPECIRNINAGPKETSRIAAAVLKYSHRNDQDLVYPLPIGHS